MRPPRLAGLFVIGMVFAVPARAGDERFETRIRPILADHCWKCHGAEKQSSGLRLDSSEAMLKGGSGEGAAIVPGNPDASPLIRAVRQQGELKMPPKSKLPDSAVRELTDWVKAGAVWPTAPSAADPARTGQVHWSFRPVRKLEPPGGVAVVSAIDAFLAAGHAAHGLQAVERADRRTLIRRASFDLTGLPPTPEEIDVFLADPRPDREAFAQVVDRLLASPHHGERWGRLWLDVARYADTKGYVFNEDKNYPFAYTYRDWVVESINEDLPYDQFLVQQIAADKLPPGPDNARLAALGFLTVGRRFLQDANEIIDDRIDVVTRGLLGLSVACARCHDHKFDPIPTEDYYSLHGVFASSEEPKDLPVLGNSHVEKEADYQKTLGERRSAVETFLTDRRRAFETELKGKLASYLTAADELDFDPRSTKFDEVARKDALRPELLRRLMARWKDRLGANDPRLSAWKAFARLPEARFRDEAPVVVATIKASPAPGVLIEAMAKPPPDSRRDVARRYGRLLARAGACPPEPSLVEFSTWLDAPDGLIRIAEADVRKLLSREERNRLRGLEKKVAELDMSHPGAPARAMVMVDKSQPTEPHVFLRGNPGRPGPAVPRRFLKILSPPARPAFTQGSGRLELARAITRPDNPLTARVMVNRIWQHHFGQGLVATPSDFGVRGEPPTHPELLDWLAATFVEGGWSIKAMHRLVMNTDAYTRRSDAPPEALALDPRNLWLARQNRRRLDFESLRDALLAVSGRLDPAIGGKSVPLEVEPFPTRRTLYGSIDRYNLEPVYRTFDFPNPDTSSPRRVATIVPQQALYLLNSPFVADQSRHLATRSEVATGPDVERVRKLHRLLFGREAQPRDIEAALRYVNRPRDAGDVGPGSPWSYGTGEIVETSGKPAVVEFRALPHWTGKGWQLGPKFPTADGNYASLTAAGGHPGPDERRSVVLRWVAPADLAIAISGTLGHDRKEGNGVRARVVSAKTGLLGSWVAHAATVATAVERREVAHGEVIDFVVDCRAEHSFDSYTWSPVIRVVGQAPSTIRRGSWEARVDFHGPEPQALTAWEAYAQALLLTNEFVYVD